MSTNDRLTLSNLYQKRHEFILQNAPHKDVTQLAKDFFEAFNLSTKTTALDTLHASLKATNNNEIAEKLKGKDFKEWATHYFIQAKKQKKLSIQNVVEKERNKLKITGVLKGSDFIKSGMDLLTSEDDSIASPPSVLQTQIPEAPNQEALVEQGEAVTHVDTTLVSATMPTVLPSPTEVQPDDETREEAGFVSNCTTISENHSSIDSEVIEGDEKLKLLAMIEKAKHTVCEWKIGDICVPCRFQDYQRDCVQALTEKKLKKLEIADAIAIIGVFAPCMPTPRMMIHFDEDFLSQLKKQYTLPEPSFDDASIMKAVRHCLNSDKDSACTCLKSLDRKLRIMLETLIEELPIKEDRSISESTFVANYISPILRGMLGCEKVSVQFPNTSSEVQRELGLKADRPDIIAKTKNSEILYGEVTGLSQEHSETKNMWDTFRLARHGKALVDSGFNSVPLLQIVYSTGTYMRLEYKSRGMSILEEIGNFEIPTTASKIPSLVGTLPTLIAVKVAMLPWIVLNYFLSHVILFINQ
ncbi:hypothetical protein BCR41DRAFT_347050 [Lobosporangium transversale]|uniref:Uncharacterized protein n=1 Tax=Lobosporangium transversale TaxID=64571 RepID=A0A1Y2GX80_9FUNG|nr:hypothetical protein BCR41DRAFT_347050 [Lobosporangium transversale]ORZ26910.1 hypothetical protein BCR41DRAFT_347050 [Lobosporangium transversale]|eukprot:XP_021884657.1 hypothetical protein BCR41DRAFT_347050 [Lobosporangium transversale]